MADKYRIVSDGNFTQVFAQNGDLIRNATSIRIEQDAGGPLVAHVTLRFLAPEIDIKAGSLNG